MRDTVARIRDDSDRVRGDTLRSRDRGLRRASPPRSKIRILTFQIGSDMSSGDGPVKGLI
jgi:hypothetical protein